MASQPTSQQVAPRGRVGERGAAGPLGLLAVFVATAMVLTVILLFVTGVAQQGILPRIRARALRVTQPEAADSTASQAKAATEHAAAGAQGAADGGAPGEHLQATGQGASGPIGRDSLAGAGQASDLAEADSLRSLRDHIRVSRQALDERVAAVQQQAALAAQQRAQTDEASERRLRTLAKVYSSMKPEAAARVMASLDDTTFARVLQKLDRRQAAKILALIDPERVARLTQEAANTTVADRGAD